VIATTRPQLTGGGPKVKPPDGAARGLTLRLRIVVVLLLVPLLPLCLMGVGAWVVFGRLLGAKALELQRAVVQSHAASIETFLATQRGLLEVIASTHSREELTNPERLRGTLEVVNRVAGGSFVDLGVVAADGAQLGYSGPYDFPARNYRSSMWFREVMAVGAFTSDELTGFREVPHFVIAVRAESAGEPWVLRATIDPGRFNALVQSGMLGSSSEAFLVNREGQYQTAPRRDSTLDLAPLPNLAVHSGLRDERVTVDGVEKIRVTTWVNGSRWLLVVQQDAAEIRAPVTRAIARGALVSSVAVLLVVLTTILATNHLQRQIDRANREREELFRAFTRSAKLASVGELATGLAHEINNPLAIISVEQTNLSDLVALAGVAEAQRQEILDSVTRIATQIQRCASITNKMLQFGRQHESTLEPTALAPRLREIAAIMERQAGARRVVIRLDVDEELPRVLVDPLELEQVMVNLFTNSFHAMPEGGTIEVAARSLGGAVLLEVRDTGHGMPAEVRERIFEPFFTTKPVGLGTGLGLSVCFGIVASWGGSIDAESSPGRGTTMRIQMPLAEP
jgi:two-component system NtrC family sensor kinase